jgi:hypothetical protein
VLLTVYWVVSTLCGPGLQAGTAESSRLQKQRSAQSTAHSHSIIKCNLSVMITKRSPWRWPSRVETCRSVLQLIIKLSLCIFWWLVFLYNIVHGHGTHKILRYSWPKIVRTTRGSRLAGSRSPRDQCPFRVVARVVYKDLQQIHKNHWRSLRQHLNWYPS